MPRTAPDSSLRVGWPFIGRDGELSAVLDRLGGPAELVGVAGEPGVGKTRLLRTAADRLRRAGWDVIWLAGSPAIAGVPLAALGPLLARPVGPTRPDEGDAGRDGTVDALPPPPRAPSPAASGTSSTSPPPAGPAAASPSTSACRSAPSTTTSAAPTESSASPAAARSPMGTHEPRPAPAIA